MPNKKQTLETLVFFALVLETVISCSTANRSFATSSGVPVQRINQPPVVEIDARPEQRTIYRGKLTAFSAKASDIDGFVRKVEFYVDGKEFAEDEVRPYSGIFTAPELGNLTITVIATDDEGRTSRSVADFEVTECPAGRVCDTELDASSCCASSPIVHWVGPRPGMPHPPYADILLEVQAKNPEGRIAAVEFFNGTRLLTVVTRPPYRFLWRRVPPGAHELTALARDESGLRGYSEINEVVVTAAEK